MSYLYHAVPKNLQGSILYPLNELKEKHPDNYKKQLSKYVGRERIIQQRIPVLDCLWNDVLHFSAVNPIDIKQALVEAGRKPDFTMSYYKIDPKLIEPKNAVVYLYAQVDIKDKMNRENFVPYNPDRVINFSKMPQDTRDYYKEMVSQGLRPLLYHKIPHILYRGTLDTANLPITVV